MREAVRAEVTHNFLKKKKKGFKAKRGKKETKKKEMRAQRRSVSLTAAFDF